MCNEVVMQTLCDYLSETDDRFLELLSFGGDFDVVTISRWVAGELIEAIFSHPMIQAEVTIENFALKMMAFRTISEERPSERIFSIAAECALEWFDFFKNGGCK